ncbi:MAG: response regulator [Bacteriovoracaceae bacterium]|nr:response regulator [Bacteriovoracaceae bacterium]
MIDTGLPPRLTNILIIDDVESVRLEMRRNLKKIGLEGKRFQAENGKEAISFLEKYKDHRDAPEFIVCDIEMPEANGLEVLNWVRSDSFYKKTPFLMVTTIDQIDIICEAVNLGSDEYIVKPWDLDTLKQRVAHCWNKYKQVIQNEED